MTKLTEPGRLKERRDESKERTSAEHEPPQLDPGWTPPIDLPWPEYGTTERG